MNKKIKNNFPRLYRFLVNTYSRIQYYRKKYSTAAQKRAILEKLYLQRIGLTLDLDHPARYTEKIQWTKLYGVDDRMIRLADKYAVRQWVSDTIGEQYLLPLITAAASFDELDFDSLPDKFVIKANNASGRNIIVRDKSALNLRDVRRKMESWRKYDYAYVSALEMQYAPMKTVFVVEKYVSDHNDEMNDYKFLCFDGVPYYCWVDTGRYGRHCRNVYDMNWVLQPWTQGGVPIGEDIAKPDNFDEMTDIAKELCRGFRQVRVDLYDVDGRIYFGEMTFTNGNGLDKIDPMEYDYLLGKLFRID